MSQIPSSCNFCNQGGCASCDNSGGGSGGGLLVPKVLITCDFCASQCEQQAFEGQCAGVGLQKDVDSEAYAVAQAYIQNYTFEQVRYRLVTEGKIPQDRVDEAIDEFRKFLIIVLQAQGSVGMISAIIDEVWHAFILFTEDYFAFCGEVFGHYLHHRPNTPLTPGDPEAGSNFVKAYNELFGDVPEIWYLS